MSRPELEFRNSEETPGRATPVPASGVVESGDSPGRAQSDALRDRARDRANEAMDRYADGDDGAFDAIYDVVVPRLLPYCRRRTGDLAKAEDLVQQTFLQMHLARDSFRRGSDVLAWSFAIATRLAIDLYRRRRSEVLSDDPHAIGQAESELSAAPEQALVAQQLARIAERALDAMPEGQREAYELVREQGFTPAEAAEILGTTQNAVNLRVHRAYDAIRAAMAAAEKVGA